MGTQSIPPHADNYAAFLARMDAASANLSTRSRSVNKALKAVALLLDKCHEALLKWEQRRSRVSAELDRHSGEPETYAALADLYDTAVKMVSMHRQQALRITDQLSLLQEHRDAIGRSLRELERSRVKLIESRSLSRDRQNLNNVLFELTGPSGAATGTPDSGLHTDLREARQAVILAEALMEVKGPR